jgi:hypothetical protein
LNLVPVAVVQALPAAIIGESVVLDGSRSTDPEGRSLTYSWELIAAPTGSAARLSNATTPLSIFVPDVVGVYQFRLVVSDGVLRSTPADVPMTVRRSNTAPIAVARAASLSVLVGQVVALDGTASYDDDRDLITYDWAMVSRPADSVSILNGVSSGQPTFLADRPGRYVLSLIANDGRVSSKASTIAVEAGIRNMPPVARAAEVAPVLVGSTVILNGSSSSDPNNDYIRFDWSFVATPGGSVPTMSGGDTVRPSFVPNVEGDYLVRLVVNDGALNSEPLIVRVSAAGANQRPTARVLAPSSVLIGETVLLDGAGSTDPNRDPLTYEWSVISKPQGSNGVVQGVRSPKATIEADRAGLYVVGLTVKDGSLESPIATHSFTAKAGNLPPVARVSTLTPSVKVGSQVVISGSTSTDPDLGDLITYQWTMISRPVGSAAELDSRSSAVPRFVADRPGLYVVGLTVLDTSKASSNTATLVIEAGSTNNPPSARAAAVNPVVVGSVAVLDGSQSSDPDLDDRITYEWQLLARPPTSSPALDLAAKNTVRPTLIPDVEGDYLVQLVVVDGSKARSEPVITRVTATRPAVNLPPVASIQAGSSSVPAGTTVVLDGASSVDPEGSVLTYEWSVISKPEGSTALLQGDKAPKATLTADRVGTYVVGLRVRDGVNSSPMVTYTVTATSLNRIPVARITALTPTSLKVGSTVVLSGATSSDPDAGDLIRYRWSLISAPVGSTAEFDSRTSAVPKFVTDRAGLYVVGLTVVDSKSAQSDLVTMVVEASAANAAPVARAVAVSPVVSLGSMTVLDGSQSIDDDLNDRITYDWRILARPPGSSPFLGLSASTSVRPTLTPDAEGDYLIQLTVSDGKARSEPVIVRVTALRAPVNLPPTASIWSLSSSVFQGATVVLDGTSSRDPEGLPLTYTWSLIAQPVGADPAVVRLQGTSAPRVTLLADFPGTYVVGLKVRDPGGVESPVVTYAVTASDTPRPIAGVVASASSRVGEPLTLDGSSSQRFSGPPLSYTWSVVSAPGNATIGEPTAMRTVIIPNAAGFWVFKLVVDQGKDANGRPINPSLPEIIVVNVN